MQTGSNYSFRSKPPHPSQLPANQAHFLAECILQAKRLKHVCNDARQASPTQTTTQPTQPPTIWQGVYLPQEPIPGLWPTSIFSYIWIECHTRPGWGKANETIFTHHNLCCCCFFLQFLFTHIFLYSECVCALCNFRLRKIKWELD